MLSVFVKVFDVKLNPSTVTSYYEAVKEKIVILKAFNPVKVFDVKLNLLSNGLNVVSGLINSIFVAERVKVLLINSISSHANPSIAAP